ncbi:MAG: hypothetical protein MJH10_20100 [Epibacterium sp.]|nr:hypothetical protein [Epibacterium sp.]NQX75779.1 hypothetical protein [Epibacterium sp.]
MYDRIVPAMVTTLVLFMSLLFSLVVEVHDLKERVTAIESPLPQEGEG